MGFGAGRKGRVHPQNPAQKKELRSLDDVRTACVRQAGVELDIDSPKPSA
jgi:hypothetical protein